MTVLPLVSPAAAGDGSGSAGGQRVLVVDDERHIVRLLQVNLERQGYTVITAASGKEALERVRSDHPDLIVLDSMMPVIDGFEVLRRVRRDPISSSIPVIMLTCSPDDEDAIRARQEGVAGFLQKPFNPVELTSRVVRCLS